MKRVFNGTSKTYPLAATQSGLFVTPPNPNNVSS